MSYCKSQLLGTQWYRAPSCPSDVFPPRDRDLGGFCCPSGRRLFASDPGITVLLTGEGAEAKAQVHVQCWEVNWVFTKWCLQTSYVSEVVPICSSTLSISVTFVTTKMCQSNFCVNTLQN